MSSVPTGKSLVNQPVDCQTNTSRWHSFEDILFQLHKAGIYLHPHQLAEFFIRHGLPVDLCYVPEPLKPKAIRINDNYRGDMARLENVPDFPWYSSSL